MFCAVRDIPVEGVVPVLEEPQSGLKHTHTQEKCEAAGSEEFRE